MYQISLFVTVFILVDNLSRALLRIDSFHRGSERDAASFLVTSRLITAGMKGCAVACACAADCQMFIYKPESRECQFLTGETKGEKKETKISPSHASAMFYYRIHGKETSDQSKNGGFGILISPFKRREMYCVGKITTDAELSRFRLRQRRVVSMAYSRRTKRLFFATYSPDTVCATRLEGEITITIKKDVIVPTMKMDDERQLLFVISRDKHVNEIFHINAKTYKSSSSIVKANDVSDMALVPQRKMFYIIERHSLISSYTYEGLKKRTLLTGLKFNRLAVDIPRGIIYFNQGKILSKMFLTNNKHYIVEQIPGHLRSIEFVDNTLFVITNLNVEIYDVLTHKLKSIDVKSFYKGKIKFLVSSVVS